MTAATREATVVAGETTMHRRFDHYREAAVHSTRSYFVDVVDSRTCCDRVRAAVSLSQRRCGDDNDLFLSLT